MTSLAVRYFHNLLAIKIDCLFTSVLGGNIISTYYTVITMCNAIKTHFRFAYIFGCKPLDIQQNGVKHVGTWRLHVTVIRNVLGGESGQCDTMTEDGDPGCATYR